VTTAREIQNELIASGRRLRAAIPGVYTGYSALHQAAMADGALPVKVKELIALAIAVTRECDGCVTAHARAAYRQGVSAQEVAEAMGVAILMNGGPGTVWGPRAYAAFEEFAGAAGPAAESGLDSDLG
jgi:AhpD family alkylhydroperoxidase